MDTLDSRNNSAMVGAPLNTSFVERLNLTIRLGSAYLFRRTICHVRWKERLEDHLELLRCHYNFVRPHRALKFGAKMRTRAMQATLTTRPMTLRKIFPPATFLWVSEKVKSGQSTVLVVVDDTPRSLAA